MHRPDAVLRGRNGLFEFLRQIVVSKPDLVIKERLGILPVVGDDARRRVGDEQAVVQIVDLDYGGETKLAGLQQNVEAVLLL